MSEELRFLQTSSSLSTIWADVLEIIRPKIHPSNFEKWFLPLHCEGFKDDCLLLRAPNRYIKEWVEDNFIGSILDAFESTGHRPYRIRIILDEKCILERKNLNKSLSLSTSSPLSKQGDSPSTKGVSHQMSSPGGGLNSPNGPHNPPTPSSPNNPKLNDKYTFDSFVVGPSNQLAQAASRAVSEFPARKYNPLFIYGGVGLGKTHLLSAIGHEVLRKNPSWNVHFITSERFMVEYINHIKTNRIEAFRKKYRYDCDILLIDDIQFIAGKDRTQEEFFHTFNVLYENRRQIVLTSDQFPHEIPGLEDRLRNRFQWGLIADIQSPELETRKAILMRKAEEDGIFLPDDVAHYLASNIKTNVRELEGALIRLAAFSNLHRREITIEFAEKTLHNIIERTEASLSADLIIKKVAHHFDLKVSDIKGKRRHRSVSYPRQIAMFLTRELTSGSYPEIGSKFGGKDHTTVMSAVKKIRKLEKEDPPTRSAIKSLKRKLQH